MIRSYYVDYKSNDGKTLTGGVLHSRSSRFGTRQDAETRAETIREFDGSHVDIRIIESKQLPEIFPHCAGKPAQAIGGKCFGCGKIMTRRDARDWSGGKSNG